MKKKKAKESNFLVQGSILAIASIIVRIMGLLYRLPLTSIIHDTGNDYYSCAYEVYSIFLLISSYSLPLAVSKMVSGHLAVGESKNAYRYFKASMLFALCSGTIVMLITFFGAKYITSEIMSTPLSYLALRVLSPTLLLVALMGVLRGFFQGTGTMVPTAISQIIEGLVNAIVSVLAAYFLFSYGQQVGTLLGEPQRYGEAYGAAGGTIGTGVGALFGLIFMVFVYVLYRDVMKKKERSDRSRDVVSYSRIFYILIITIIPVILSTTVYNVSSILDQGIFKKLMIAQKIDETTRSTMWGVFSGKTKVLINVPLAIANSLAASTIPSLTAAIMERNLKKARYRISVGIRFVMVLTIPCAIAFLVMGKPILELLFSDSTVMSERLLQFSAISVVFYALSTLTNGILQGINHMSTPVKHAAISLGIHLVSLFLFIAVFHMNIYGVAAANIVFALCMCVLNNLSLRKYIGYRQETRRTFLIPSIAGAAMGLVILLLRFLFGFLPISSKITTCLIIPVAVLVYGVALLKLKGLTPAEIKRFPKGTALLRLAKRFHLI